MNCDEPECEQMAVKVLFSSSFSQLIDLQPDPPLDSPPLCFFCVCFHLLSFPSPIYKPLCSVTTFSLSGVLFSSSLSSA